MWDAARPSRPHDEESSPVGDYYDWNRDGRKEGYEPMRETNSFPIPKWEPPPERPPMTPLRYAVTMLAVFAIQAISLAFLPRTSDIIQNAVLPPDSHASPPDGVWFFALLALMAASVWGMIAYWRRLTDIGFAGLTRRVLFGLGWFLLWPLAIVAVFIPTGGANALSQIRLKPILLIAVAIGACVAGWFFVVQPAIHFHALSVACSSNANSVISLTACRALMNY
jgi:hypothetical protein